MKEKADRVQTAIQAACRFLVCLVYRDVKIPAVGKNDTRKKAQRAGGLPLNFVFFWISLGKKLFGEGYSGLEYDYRGLIKLYNSIGNYEKVFEYHNVLANWNRLRDRQFSVTDALEDVSTSPQSTEEVVQSFLMSQNVDGQSS